MTWTPIPLGPASGDVLATVTKSRLTLSLGSAAARMIGWSELESPNVALALGEGENAGWLRIISDEDGTTLEPDATGRLSLALPASTLPALQVCKNSPLTYRPAEGALEIRLPVAAPTAQGRPAPPRPRVVAGREAAPTQDGPNIEVIPVPDLYRGVHAEAWRLGVEMAFLSDGTAVVNGRIVSMDDFESVVTAAMDRAKAANSRASA